MAKLREWLRPPRKLLILFFLVMFPPAATLVGLGVRLLDQDRKLAHQRQSEILEHASDTGVRALEQDLAILAKRLSGPSWGSADVPEDSVYVVFGPDRILATPPGRLPYYPVGQNFRESAAEPFRELEAQEFRERNLEKALEIGRKLAASPDASLRAGALLRQARVLRKLHRLDEALAAYQSLSRIPSVAIDGVSADLLARRARCVVLEEQARKAELRWEATAIEGDLRAGTWQLDQASFLQIAGQLSRWLGADVHASAEGEALAAGVDWLYLKWTSAAPDQPGSTGQEILTAGSMPVTIFWASEAGRVTAFVAGSGYLQNHWLAELQKAVHPARACLLGAGGKAIAGDLPPAEALSAQRAATGTGLPWSVVVTGAEETSGEFAARRRVLLAGLAAVLVLVVAGSYFIWRSVTRETAVARLQADFVAAVSHEFRTPLTTLRQFNELLAEEEDLPAEKHRSYHQAQTRATERLQRLVESLLDFGRMEAGSRPYRFERLNVGALVKDVTDEFRGEAGTRGFSVECSPDSCAYPVDADSEALARALGNLLDNAAKYSGDSRRIEVTVRHADSAVSIAVRDYGIGIPLPEQGRIFQKFVRGAAAKSQGIKGTGIGLAMVRHIVHAHGGSVRVTSAPGAGSTFTIVLPAKE